MSRSTLILAVLFAFVISGCPTEIHNHFPDECGQCEEDCDDPIGDDDDSTDPGDDDSADDDDDSADDDDTTGEECEYEFVTIETGWPVDQLMCDGGIPFSTEITDGEIMQAENSNGMWVAFAQARYTFPSESEFMSWYGDEPCPACETVVETDMDTVTSFLLSGNVTVRPGSIIAYEVMGEDYYYLVDVCHTIRSVTPELAEEIFGSDWEDHVYVVYTPFISDYHFGPQVESVNDFDLAATGVRTLEEELTCVVEDPDPDPDPMVYVYEIGPYFETAMRGRENVLVTNIFVEALSEELSFQELVLDMRGDSDMDPTNGVDDLPDPQERFLWCWLEHNGVDLTGPRPVESDGLLEFTGFDITLPVNDYQFVSVICDVSSTNMGEQAFAVVVVNKNDVSITDAQDLDLDSAAIIMLDGQIGEVEDELNANFTHYLEVVAETELTISMALGSPSGAAIPGINETLRFDLYADTPGDVTAQEIPFTITSTDNGASEWNRCGNLGNSTKWLLSDLFGNQIAVDWTFYDQNGGLCFMNPDNVIGHAVAEIDPGFHINAATVETLSLSVDTLGASAANDDSIRTDISWAEQLAWMNILFHQFTGLDPETNGVPVIGGIQVY